MAKSESDAANRLVKVRNEVYSSIGLDKIANVTEDGKLLAEFNDHTDGQLAEAKRGGKSEAFLWDGLALIHRGDTSYVNEPHANGGSPVRANGKPMFNDMLGTTLGRKNGTKYTSSDLTSFGDADSPKDCFDVRATSSAHEKNNVFFTGKPYIGELGYAFLFRNYRPEQGKWQTADPLGYPDGWNQMAYCNNEVTNGIDFLGGWTLISDTNMPPVPEQIEKTICSFSKADDFFCNIMATTTFTWVQVGSIGGTNCSLSLRYVNANATSASYINNQNQSFTNSISASVSAKTGIPSNEISSSISSSVSTSISAGYSIMKGISSTIEFEVGYTATASAGEYTDLLAYQLIATTTYSYIYSTYLGKNPNGTSNYSAEFGFFGSTSVNLQKFGNRIKKYE